MKMQIITSYYQLASCVCVSADSGFLVLVRRAQASSLLIRSVDALAFTLSCLPSV